MEKLFEIENHKIGFKCSAGTVRAYRMDFGRDLIRDIAEAERELVETKALTAESAGVAESMAYVMAKEYDPDIPPMEEWLEQFSPYFIYNCIALIIGMWVENTQTLNKTKKNKGKQSENGHQRSSSSEQPSSD